LIEERLFHNLPPHVWAGVDAICNVATFAKVDVLFVEEQKPLGVFMLPSGRAKLSASSGDGKPLIVGRAWPGEVLGLPTWYDWRRAVRGISTDEIRLGQGG
jgi:CRP-like cAMP-binding protein